MFFDKNLLLLDLDGYWNQWSDWLTLEDNCKRRERVCTKCGTGLECKGSGVEKEGSCQGKN